MTMQDTIAALTTAGYAVKTAAVHKTNRTEDAFAVQIAGNTVAPVITEDILTELLTPAPESEIELIERILEFTNAHSKQTQEIANQITDPDFVRSHIHLDVCNADWNQELLSDTPHRLVAGTDLAVYGRVLGEEIGGTVRLTYNLADILGIHPDDLLDQAVRNSAQYTIKDMAELFGIGAGSDPLMLVLMTAEDPSSASVVYNSAALDEACDRFRSDSLFVLPSSIFEVIAVPASISQHPAELAAMVSEINENVVDRNIQLSEHVFRYRKGAGFETQQILAQ